jgi:putative endonuclease
VTNDLVRRIEEHKHKMFHKSFSARYKIDKLVCYENYTDIGEAIAREKQLKAVAYSCDFGQVNGFGAIKQI